jgi:uncharacterized protein with ParB-like and HNH nuclease domain
MNSEPLLYADNIQENDDNGQEEPEYLSVPRYLITNYGADFDVEGLIKRLDRGDIFVPNFQRSYVWNQKQASQFIESILLGLPIPGIILALDDDESEQNKRKMYVVDGLQRLTTLRSFVKGTFPDGKEFRLTDVDVDPEFNGKSYLDLSSGDQRTINDYLIHATIIRQEKPDKDKTGIYFVFRRLNTNGSPLKPQEIRSAIFQGRFDTILEQLNTNEAWKKIYRGKQRSLRKSDEELILRFFALFYAADQYEKPMENFLNRFMGDNKNLEKYSPETLETLFNTTITTIYQSIGDNAFRLIQKRSLFNNAIFDAVMVGVAKNLNHYEILGLENLAKRYHDLVQSEMFIRLVTGATTDNEGVRSRIQMAINAFDPKNK